jgi:hypothetical protein
MEWAKQIDPLKVPEKQRHHAECYKGMILEKGNAIIEITAKFNKYSDDIEEYLSQLRKIGVSNQPSVEHTEPTTDNSKEKEEPYKAKSPLLP